jgi:hypothetical protein
LQAIQNHLEKVLRADRATMRIGKTELRVNLVNLRVEHGTGIRSIMDTGKQVVVQKICIWVNVFVLFMIRESINQHCLIAVQ